ncbi:carboxylate-amine ligase [bacterium]|nr:carboxylate-amine ligase [bacterium]
MNNQKPSLRISSLDGQNREAVSESAAAASRHLMDYFADYCPLSQLPPPGSAEEDKLFNMLCQKLKPMWQALSGSVPMRELLVIVPSLTLDADELLKINGIEYYEERLLFLLIQLTNPRTEVIYITSQPIRESIVDYYLQLLPGVPYSHARRRLHMYSVHDASRDISLTQKVLDRPALLQRIRNHVKGFQAAHLSVFNVTPAEKSLSAALGLPLMGADPKFIHYGSKSGARKLFKQAGVPCPAGFEDLRDENDIMEATVDLYFRNPKLKRVVVKINEGFSGEGNAIYKFSNLLDVKPSVHTRAQALAAVRKDFAETLQMQAPHLPYEKFISKYRQMGGIVEEFLEGVEKASPSVQTRLTPTQEVQIISTHDQIMGGADKQVFLGCFFPAPREFHQALHEGGLKVGRLLAEMGLSERVSLDYMAVPHIPELPVSKDNPWDMYAIEINMRKGGTTHPFRTLQFLTGGRYDADSGLFITPRGSNKYYIASDNLVAPEYKGLLPEDVIDIITHARLHFNSNTNTGDIFHMIGATSQHGKFGVTCIGNSPEEAKEFYRRTLQILHDECSIIAGGR